MGVNTGLSIKLRQHSFLVLCFLTLFCINSLEGVRRDCRVRSNRALQRQWSRYIRNDTRHGAHASFMLEPATQAAIQEQLAAMSPSSQPQLSLDSRIDFDQPLRSRSLCTWEYVRNVDESRFPAILIESRPTRSSCLDGLGQCEDIVFNVRVLRNSGKCDFRTGQYVYEPGYERLVVGSTCALPQSV